MRVNRHDRKRMKKRMAGEKVNKEMGFLEGAGNFGMHMLHRIDDSTQAFARNQLLQLPTDGTRLQDGASMKMLRNLLGDTVFSARAGYGADPTAYRGTGTTNDNIGLGLGRALQGGTITAAGAGLAALSGQFGGQADQPEPAQLPLN